MQAYLLRVLSHHELRVHGALNGAHRTGIEAAHGSFRELTHRLDLNGGMSESV